jgi:hypothetical protein
VLFRLSRASIIDDENVYVVNDSRQRLRAHRYVARGAVLRGA